MNPLMRTGNSLPALVENFFGRDIKDFLNTSMSSFNNVPAVNVVEYEDGFQIEVAAPGLKKEDVKLNLNHNNRSQEAAREAAGKADRRYTRREFNYSSFQRIFTLPTSVNVNAIQAYYANGLLRIEVPKWGEAKVKPPRQIKIGR